MQKVYLSLYAHVNLLFFPVPIISFHFSCVRVLVHVRVRVSACLCVCPVCFMCLLTCS